MILVDDIPFCLKCNNNNNNNNNIYIYIYSVEHVNVFIALVANSFGHYGSLPTFRWNVNRKFRCISRKIHFATSRNTVKFALAVSVTPFSHQDVSYYQLHIENRVLKPALKCNLSHISVSTVFSTRGVNYQYRTYCFEKANISDGFTLLLNSPSATIDFVYQVLTPLSALCRSNRSHLIQR
jgi:hypothetical protein